ncbi:MAG: MFS transporter [Terrimicrobiaceae bacterium]|nr:MFS transporter [Terrimicrobiaceae bacterium]
MKTLLRTSGLPGLLIAQSQVAFNDNATKLVLIGVVQMLLPPEEAALWVGLIALLLVAPFVLFAPLTGWLADRFPKRDVLSWSLWLQLGIMVALAAAFSIQSLVVAVLGFFLLGTQSALMAPARRGMVKDLTGGRVGEAVGWMEMLCIVAILVGSLAGGQMIDGLTAVLDSPWTGAIVSSVLLAVGCVGALVAFRGVPHHAAAGSERFSARVLLGHDRLVAILRRDRGIWRAAWGDAAFYLVGGFLMLTLSQVGRELFPDGPGAARTTGIMMAVLGGGVAVGSLVAARMSRRQIALGLVPAGALGMAGALAVGFGVPFGSPWLLGVLGVAGFFGGWYLVPLGAYLVDRARDGERGQVLAGSGMLSSIAGVVAVGLHALATALPGIGIRGQLLLAAGFLVLVAIWSLRLLAAPVLRIVALNLARIRYRVRAVGASNMPPTGGRARVRSGFCLTRDSSARPCLAHC